MAVKRACGECLIVIYLSLTPDGIPVDRHNSVTNTSLSISVLCLWRTCKWTCTDSSKCYLQTELLIAFLFVITIVLYPMGIILNFVHCFFVFSFLKSKRTTVSGSGDTSFICLKNVSSIFRLILRKLCRARQ